jgi:uncharacterized Tic20 family protein
MVAEEITDETPQDDIEENENLMQEDEPAADEPAPEQLPPPPKAGLSTSQENTWSMLAHLSILLNLFTGFLGPVAALIIYLVYKDRSRYIAYQSLQSAIFQLITWIGVGLVIGGLWLITLLLSVVLIGLLCMPFTLLATIILLLVPLASLVYGVYGAIRCSDGEDFRYWLVGDWVRSTYKPA